jgi:hypothetical protein
MVATGENAGRVVVRGAAAGDAVVRGSRDDATEGDADSRRQKKEAARMHYSFSFFFFS